MAETSQWKPTRPFEPRAIKFKEVLVQADWQMKWYVVLYPENDLNWEELENGTHLALNALPIPASTSDRGGLGFIISHQGRSHFSISTCWWDRETDLSFNRITKPLDHSEDWRGMTDGRSLDVWDLEIFWFEREAYVNAILAKAENPDYAGYLEQRLYG